MKIGRLFITLVPKSGQWRNGQCWIETAADSRTYGGPRDAVPLDQMDAFLSQSQPKEA